MQDIDKIIFGAIGGLVVGVLLEPIKFWMISKLKIAQIRKVLYRSFCINYWRLKNFSQVTISPGNAESFIRLIKSLDFDSFRYFREKEPGYYYQLQEAIPFIALYDGIQRVLDVTSSSKGKEFGPLGYFGYVLTMFDLKSSPSLELKNVLEDFENSLKYGMLNTRMFQKAQREFDRDREKHLPHYLEFENMVDVLAVLRGARETHVERIIGNLSARGARWLGIWLFRKLKNWWIEEEKSAIDPRLSLPTKVPKHKISEPDLQTHKVVLPVRQFRARQIGCGYGYLRTPVQCTCARWRSRNYRTRERFARVLEPSLPTEEEVQEFKEQFVECFRTWQSGGRVFNSFDSLNVLMSKR